MSPEYERFMRLQRWPAILTREQTAWALGFQLHDIATLMRKRLLRPLGDPANNGSKFFAMVEIEELAKDKRWLGKARDAVKDHWLQKNNTASHSGSADDDGIAS